MEEKIISLINGDGKTGYPHAKEWNLTSTLHHSQKLTQDGLDSNVRLEQIKHLEKKSWGKCFLTLVLATIFLDVIVIPKASVTKGKINKWDYIKLKIFWKENNQQNEKATYRMEENICKPCIW